jgi:hypothetical protein
MIFWSFDGQKLRKSAVCNEIAEEVATPLLLVLGWIWYLLRNKLSKKINHKSALQKCMKFDNLNR